MDRGVGWDVKNGESTVSSSFLGTDVALLQLAQYLPSGNWMCGLHDNGR